MNQNTRGAFLLFGGRIFLRAALRARGMRHFVRPPQDHRERKRASAEKFRRGEERETMVPLIRLKCSLPRGVTDARDDERVASSSESDKARCV